MKTFIAILATLLLSFTKVGGNSKIIYQELKDRLGFETFVDISVFNGTEQLNFYGFSNLPDVNFMIIKLTSPEKKGGLDATTRFMKSLYPNRSEVHFIRNNFFCIVLFDEAKKTQATNVRNVLDELFFRNGSNYNYF